MLTLHAHQPLRSVYERVSLPGSSCPSHAACLPATSPHCLCAAALTNYSMHGMNRALRILCASAPGHTRAWRNLPFEPQHAHTPPQLGTFRAASAASSSGAATIQLSHPCDLKIQSRRQRSRSLGNPRRCQPLVRLMEPSMAYGVPGVVTVNGDASGGASGGASSVTRWFDASGAASGGASGGASDDASGGASGGESGDAVVMRALGQTLGQMVMQALVQTWAQMVMQTRMRAAEHMVEVACHPLLQA
eukprot:28338-Chlamydomonas_euryale.AAC.2